jgi:hypothetical protein
MALSESTDKHQVAGLGIVSAAERGTAVTAIVLKVAINYVHSKCKSDILREPS